MGIGIAQLEALTDKELWKLHKSGTLHEHVDVFPSSEICTMLCDTPDQVMAATHKSILGEAAVPEPEIYMQVPPELVPLRDRLFYIMLMDIDLKAALAGGTYETLSDAERIAKSIEQEFEERGAVPVKLL